MPKTTPRLLPKSLCFLLVIVLLNGLTTNAHSQASGPLTVCFQPEAKVGNDILLSSLTPTTNYGTHGDIDLDAWTVNGDPVTLRSMLKFDQLAMIPPGSSVQSAKLYLFFNPTSTNGNDHSQASGPNDGLVVRVSGPWNELTTTWSTQPGTLSMFSTLAEDVVPVHASNTSTEDYVIDLAAMTQYWINHPADNHGMLLRLVDESYYRRLLFASSDHVDNTKHPKLCITYTLPPDTSFTCFQPDSVLGKDAVIESLHPNLNLGAHPDNLATGWTVGGQIDTLRSLIQFVDLASIAPGTHVFDAKLYLFNNPYSNNTDGMHSQLSGSNVGVVTRVTSPWDENLVTWNNAPTTTSMFSPLSTDAVSVHASNYGNENYVITVTDMVQHMVDNPATDYGFMLRLVDETHFRSLIFASSDNALSNLHPRLCVRTDSLVSITPKLETKSRAQLYPNPAQHRFHVEILGEDAVTATLINAQGQVVWQQAVEGLRTFTVDRRMLAAGIYHLHVNYVDHSSSHHKVCFQ